VVSSKKATYEIEMAADTKRRGESKQKETVLDIALVAESRE
jgi:hypothetical protein